MPSPVIPTTSPAARSAVTMRSLWAGVARAITAVPASAAASAVASSASISAPVSTGASTSPACAAIAAAVTGWSPVIMRTRTPARRHAAIVAAVPSRSGSSSPTRPASAKS